MAVNVTDNRTTITTADDEALWNTGTAGGTVYVEGGLSIIETLNIETGQIYYSDGGNISTSGRLLYIWSNNFALQDSWDAADPPNAVHLGDGTNNVSFKMAGNNRKVFAHLDTDTGITADWDCLVLDGDQVDTMNTDGLTVVRSGTYNDFLASHTNNQLNLIGVDFTTLSKGLGGGVNVAVDIIRAGNDGISITGGTTSDRGTFLEVVLLDRSTASGRAHGIIRELSTGLYSAQGPLNFGSSTIGEDSWFEDAGRVLTFENRNIANDKYYINVEGNASFSNHFLLSDTTVTTAGPWVGMTFNSGNLDELKLTNMNFTGLGNRDIIFSSNADATNHLVDGSNFSSCGPITAGDVTFTDCSFNAPAGTHLFYINTNTTNQSNLSFDGSGGGHGILIDTPGTYDFDNFGFSNFGADETTDAAVYNNSSGAVTINILNGGDGPTVRNGTGATTTVNNPISFTITNIISDSEVRLLDQSDLSELAGAESVSDTPTGVNGLTISQDPNDATRYQVTYNYNYSADLPIYIVIFVENRLPIYQSFTLGSTDSSFFATQTIDRQYQQ